MSRGQEQYQTTSTFHQQRRNVLFRRSHVPGLRLHHERLRILRDPVQPDGPQHGQDGGRSLRLLLEPDAAGYAVKRFHFMFT
ncbi:hypothetical protein N3K66_001523 [Trichothecium roseum]|uniref:Uncharacterized protein n=1 Tax=Trichothecium roseum TaxID=47278 RepID=A0ACC0VFM5_9HYPO|nr:hypothetical protein N3K66_001523 [Trichothecium roseum]